MTGTHQRPRRVPLLPAAIVAGLVAVLLLGVVLVTNDRDPVPASERSAPRPASPAATSTSPPSPSLTTASPTVDEDPDPDRGPRVHLRRAADALADLSPARRGTGPGPPAAALQGLSVPAVPSRATASWS